VIELTAEEYLEQIKKIDAMISNKKRDYERWANVADGLGDFSVSERVKTSRNLHRGSDAIIEYISIEGEIKALEKKRKGIIETLQQLPCDEYKILYAIYVDGCRVKELPSRFKMSNAWVKWKKRQALDHVQILIDK
jgi:hypothetical protein